MAVNRERAKVWREVTSLDLDYDSLADVITTLERYRAAYGDATRIQKQEYGYGDDGYYWAVMQERDETDAEMHKRIAQELLWEAEQAEQDRRDFARLKAKFGV